MRGALSGLVLLPGDGQTVGSEAEPETGKTVGSETKPKPSLVRDTLSVLLLLAGRRANRAHPNPAASQPPTRLPLSFSHSRNPQAMRGIFF
jgi:hypothetical protein